MTDRLRGVHTIMPTPFTGHGELDLASLESLTEFLIDLGVDGLVVLGVMGEAPKLAEDEQEAVIATTVKVARGRVPVFAGSGAAGTDLAIRKSRRARELGAAGLLLAPPPVQQDAVITEYYRRIDEAVDCPIILHDYPAATQILLSPQLVARLHAGLEWVRVIKLEEPPTAPKVSAIRALGSKIAILGGLGGLYYLEELERGADGMMTGFAYPDVLVAIQRAWDGGERAKAASLFFGACALMRFEFQPVIGLALRKEIYRRRGAIKSAFVRHPGSQFDERLGRELDRVLEATSLAGVVA